MGQKTGIISTNKLQNDLKQKFGNRLVLKSELGNSRSNIMDRLVKGAKRDQLDNSSSAKWGHDKYDGAPKTAPRSAPRSAPTLVIKSSAKQHKVIQIPKRVDAVQVEEHDIVKPKVKEYSQNKVLVRGLPSDISKENVAQIFERYGAVKKAQVEDGFAIVTFSTNESALQAHYITNHKKLLKIKGNAIKVTIIEDEERNFE